MPHTRTMPQIKSFFVLVDNPTRHASNLQPSEPFFYLCVILHVRLSGVKRMPLSRTVCMVLIYVHTYAWTDLLGSIYVRNSTVYTNKCLVCGSSWRVCKSSERGFYKFETPIEWNDQGSLTFDSELNWISLITKLCSSRWKKPDLTAGLAQPRETKLSNLFSFALLLRTWKVYFNKQRRLKQLCPVYYHIAANFVSAGDQTRRDRKSPGVSPA